MEIPPKMPKRGLRVWRANSSPWGAKISTSRRNGRSGKSCGHQCRATWRIIFRGTGLMAGSPGGTGRPGLVTNPTPSPRRKITSPAGAAAVQQPHLRPDQGPMRDVRVIPGIFDYSGPPRHCPSSVWPCTGTRREPPPGRGTSRLAGASLSARARSAAVTAPAAAVPVEKPVRRLRWRTELLIWLNTTISRGW